jgi:hypothetical protein
VSAGPQVQLSRGCMDGCGAARMLACVAPGAGCGLWHTLRALPAACRYHQTCTPQSLAGHVCTWQAHQGGHGTCSFGGSQAPPAKLHVPCTSLVLSHHKRLWHHMSNSRGKVVGLSSVVEPGCAVQQTRGSTSN